MRKNEKNSEPEICHCDTGKSYHECCKILHEGGFAKDALALMRSRYSGYAKGLSSYIIHTTHPLNPNYRQKEIEWNKEILFFCENTKFLKLEILDFTDGAEGAFVTFIAHLRQSNSDIKLTEKSLFKKVSSKWLYLKGDHSQS